MSNLKSILKNPSAGPSSSRTIKPVRQGAPVSNGSTNKKGSKGSVKLSIESAGTQHEKTRGSKGKAPISVGENDGDEVEIVQEGDDGMDVDDKLATDDEIGMGKPGKTKPVQSEPDRLFLLSLSAIV